MTKLSDVQAWMAEMLRRERELTGDQKISEEARKVATGNDRLSPAEQVEIYREQFWLRHTSSLLEDFEGLSRIVGQADWERLAEEYLTAHPPTSYSLRDLGDRFPEFVEKSAKWLTHHDLCVDMARLEWCYIEVFDAADSETLDPETIAAVPEEAWESARLVTSPALRLLRVRYPVAQLRKALRTEHDQAVLIPGRERQNLVIYRGLDRNLYHDTLGEGAFALLEALVEGVPLVAACQQAIDRVPEEAGRIETSLAAWFQDWTARAWIVGVELED